MDLRTGFPRFPIQRPPWHLILCSPVQDAHSTRVTRVTSIHSLTHTPTYPLPSGRAALPPLSECLYGQNPNPSDGHPASTTSTASAPAHIKGGGISWQHPMLLERAAPRSASAFPSAPPESAWRVHHAPARRTICRDAALPGLIRWGG
jgi:hypothetical protein